jgi:hypothetical protein
MSLHIHIHIHTYSTDVDIYTHAHALLHGIGCDLEREDSFLWNARVWILGYYVGVGEEERVLAVSVLPLPHMLWFT